MKLLLFVVPLPMTIEEFQRGQIFSRAKRDEADCLNGEFSFTVKNEFRSHEKLGNVLFTERINYISKKLPNALKSIFTSLKEAKAIEKTFDNFPFVIDEYENQPFADSLKVSAQTFHKDDRGNSDPKTMFNLSSEEMKILQIINLNISKVNKKKKLKSFRPIFEGWINVAKPVMTMYKLIKMEFNYFGLQYIVENIFQNYMKSYLLNLANNIYLTMDDWYNLKTDEVEKIASDLNEKIGEMLKKSNPDQNFQTENNLETD